MGSNILNCWYHDGDFSHELRENSRNFVEKIVFAIIIIEFTDKIVREKN